VPAPGQPIVAPSSFAGQVTPQREDASIPAPGPGITASRRPRRELPAAACRRQLAPLRGECPGLPGAARRPRPRALRRLEAAAAAAAGGGPGVTPEEAGSLPAMRCQQFPSSSPAASGCQVTLLKRRAASPRGHQGPAQAMACVWPPAWPASAGGQEGNWPGRRCRGGPPPFARPPSPRRHLARAGHAAAWRGRRRHLSATGHRPQPGCRTHRPARSSGLARSWGRQRRGPS
jgi:hypothetical protein